MMTHLFKANPPIIKLQYHLGDKDLNQINSRYFDLKHLTQATNLDIGIQNTLLLLRNVKTLLILLF